MTENDSTHVTVAALRSALAGMPDDALVVIETAVEDLPTTHLRVARSLIIDGLMLRVSDTPRGVAA